MNNITLNNDELLLKINDSIKECKIKLDYNVYQNSLEETNMDYDNMVNFINKNYLVNPKSSIIYTVSLLKIFVKKL